MLRGLTRSHSLILLLCLLTSCKGQDYSAEEGSAGGSKVARPESTLNDDEDFAGKIPVTFFANSTLQCSEWKEADRRSGSQTLINEMIVYVASICECVFGSGYLSPFQSKCDIDTGMLLVSTNISLPYNHQHSQLVTYLENWIKTEPIFKKTLHNAGTATVRVVMLEKTHSTYTDGSGEKDEELSKMDTPDVTDDEQDEAESGSGSGLEDIDVEGSSMSITTDIGALLLTCVAVLVYHIS